MAEQRDLQIGDKINDCELRIDDEFNSYEEFYNKFIKYQEEKGVLFVKRDSKTIESANKLLSRKAVPYADKHKFKYIRFNCKQGPGRQTESVGLRLTQR